MNYVDQIDDSVVFIKEKRAPEDMHTHDTRSYAISEFHVGVQHMEIQVEMMKRAHAIHAQHTKK